ncbi:hypothetical protein SLEP1_g52684 [Rubroshorea leprosula]|uniref:Disease resistance protein At4g27190-like leucine-rich repeats domain-containing protein n=1 Tax=Rubroshorea leprosula TaxID=152421 RepID=A0AAV5M717_9ROSI|nr:hypothetical protein SLEP1_g52684 [Rubroshorea leprosula]
MHLWKEESHLKSIFYNLRTLEVLECIKLVNLVPSVVSFENLQTLEISKCHGLENLVSYSTAKSLEKLKRMSITDCYLVEEIVKCMEDNVKDGIVYSQLQSLQLRCLPKLSSFCTGKCDLEFPSLKEVIVIGCPQMKYFSLGKTVTKELQNVQWTDYEERGHWVTYLDASSGSIKISEFSEIEIWKKNLKELALLSKRLQYLEVSNCNRLSYLLTPSMVLSLVQLKDLTVEYCATMEQVIMAARVEEVVETDLIFPQLESISIESCSKLSSFYVGSNTLKLPMLKQITIKDCLKMVRFASKFSSEQEKEIADGRSKEMVEFPNLELLKLSSLNVNQIWIKNHEEISSFKKLQRLEVCNCSSLSYLLTPSMALDLVQLEDLEIKDCAAMEQVIMAAGVEEVVETGLIFPQLESISLDSCSKLSSFYVGSNALKLPMLEKITIKDCLKMVRFASKFSSEKEIADGRSEEMVVKKEPDIFNKAFFCDEVEIPNLEMLTLSSMNTKQIWNSQLLSISSFAQNLTELKVVNCSNLKYMFTISMIKSFVQLERLGISGCEMMEVVILIERTMEEDKICQTVFPKLETLTLNDLPQLATFCSNCDSLGKISDSERVNFDTVSQKLLATRSTLVETEATKLVFSQVTELLLRLLPKFKSFFPQMHITEWPSLKSLVVIECHGVQIVASEFSSTEMTHGDSQLERESQHLMFWISKATFPSLKRLVVKWNDNIKIQCGHHPEEYFGKLKVLHLLGFPKQSALLPPFFFHSLPNLEKLLVKDAFFDEIFQCEEVTGEEKPVCGRTPLRKLRLSKLHELTHLWKEESQLEVDILRNLQTLKVQECSRLKNLVPSTVYFDNLRALVVSECHGLVNLVRYSTAKSLGRLFTMKVANCEMIEEIVVCSGDAVKDGIVFSNLNYLQLKGLPRLESFCSGDCNFKFPALREVIVTECPNMQIFSQGELSAPELHKVKLTGDTYEHMDGDIDEDIEKRIDDIFNKDEDEDDEDEDDEVEDEGSWQGNLNSTIQQLFKEKNA